MDLAKISVQADREGWPISLMCPCGHEMEWVPESGYEWPSLAELIERAQRHIVMDHGGTHVLEDHEHLT
jgi:hypothetical protein